MQERFAGVMLVTLAPGRTKYQIFKHHYSEIHKHRYYLYAFPFCYILTIASLDVIRMGVHLFFVGHNISSTHL